jgi:hypothetical protein
MPMEYSEYKSLVDILSETDNINSTTYEDLMSKEKNVLSTVNHVIKHINDKNLKAAQFKDMSIEYIFKRFFLIWPEIIHDLSNAKTTQEYYLYLVKDDRMIYYGISLIIISFLLFYIQ